MENNSTRTAGQSEQNRDAKFTESFWAYALLSWLMATVPALMILPKLYGSSPSMDENLARNVQLIMIGLCSFFGATGGLFIGLMFAVAGWKERMLPMFLAPLFGGIWGIVIGVIGSFPIFFIGGFILGWMIAVPLGLVGFTLFAVIYEPLAARRRLRWRHIVLIEGGILSLLLSGGYYLLQLNNL